VGVARVDPDDRVGFRCAHRPPTSARNGSFETWFRDRRDVDTGGGHLVTLSVAVAESRAAHEGDGMDETMPERLQKTWIVGVCGDVARELEVEFAPNTTIAELGQALAAELSPDVVGDWILSSERLERELDPGDPITASGLVTGDRVELLAAARSLVGEHTHTGAVDLVVVGGALLGARYRLEAGTHVVGRGSGSDVQIDDPAMSRRHFEITVTADGAEVADVGSTNGTFIDGERLTSVRRLGPKDVVEAGASLLSVEPTLALTSGTASAGVEIPFNRPPRIRSPHRDLEVHMPTPPDEPSGPRIPLAASIVPLIIGVAMVVLFPENKAMLLFFAMTPVMAVWSFLEDRRSGAKSFKHRKSEYVREVASREQHLASFLDEEVNARRDSFPGVAELRIRVKELSPRLWERRPTDSDFLSIRVGWGDEPSRARVVHPSDGTRALREETAQRFARYTTLRAVPITVDLRSSGTTGFCGASEDVIRLARWSVVQLAALHSPDEVEMGGLFPTEKASDWDWLKWLPHFGAFAGEARLAFGGDALQLAERLTPSPETRAAPSGPHTIVFVDEDCDLPRSALGRLLGTSRDGNLSVVWLGRDPNALPGECRAIVEVDAGADRLRTVYPEKGVAAEFPSPEGISADHARSIARALAAVRDSSVGKKRRSLPADIPLWETLDLRDPTPSAVRSAWDARRKGRRVRLGTTPEGPLQIDLRRDGPHALIGGTTGSGKSELLQSMIAALALEHPPDRVNLLLIDYKGGTAFKELAALPHVVGLVTDLDGHLSRRTLVSLEAELKRRERVLRDAGARDVIDLEVKKGLGLPDLVLVIDEFAALVAELPEFVDGVVDIAQRGRALGLHLVLATQKPAGVVSEKIRANTNLRIALRMSDESDSTDVIGLPDAAYIPRTTPGRGFVRTGHGEIAEFQSAYASARAVTARSHGISLRRLAPAGPTDERIEPSERGTSGTQLEVLVESIAAAGEDLPAPFSPVLPALPDLLPLDALGPPSERKRFPIGLADEPSAQRQHPFELDVIRQGSVLIFGTGGTGKTTLLRTIAASIATYSEPDEVHVYGLDLGTRGLEALEALPHCGSVVFAEEEERIRRLFAMLRDEISTRRVDSGTARPEILVLLDGYAGFAAAFERVDFGEMVDALPRLVADGRQVGVHFVITADRRGSVPAALTGMVSTRIVLRLADDDEYVALGLSSGPDKEALATRGRAFLGNGVLMQCAVAGEAGSATDQIEAIEALGTRRPATKSAAPVRTLPPLVSTDAIPSPESSRLIPFGLDERLQPVSADLSESHFLVCGARRSGRSTVLSTIATRLAALDPTPPLHLLAPRRVDLPTHVGWASVVVGPDDCQEWCATAQDALRGAPGTTVFIDDGDELLEMLAADALARTMKWARDHDVRFVVAAETHAVQRAFGGWIAEIRKDKHGLLLDPDVEVDGDLLSVRLPRRKIPFPPGRGFLVARGEVRLIQVAKTDAPARTD